MPQLIKQWTKEKRQGGGIHLSRARHPLWPPASASLLDDWSLSFNILHFSCDLFIYKVRKQKRLIHALPNKNGNRVVFPSISDDLYVDHTPFWARVSIILWGFIYYKVLSFPGHIPRLTFKGCSSQQCEQW